MNIWKQIQKLNSNDEEYDNKMEAASNSTVISIKKLEQLRGERRTHERD